MKRRHDQLPLRKPIRSELPHLATLPAYEGGLGGTYVDIKEDHRRLQEIKPSGEVRHSSFLPYCEDIRPKQEESRPELEAFAEGSEISLNSHGNPVQPGELGTQAWTPTSRTHGKRTGSLAERTSEISPFETQAFCFASLAHRKWLTSAADTSVKVVIPLPLPCISYCNII